MADSGEPTSGSCGDGPVSDPRGPLVCPRSSLPLCLRLSSDPLSVIFSFLVPLTRPLSRTYSVDWMIKFGTYLQPHGQVDTYNSKTQKLYSRMTYHNGKLHGCCDRWGEGILRAGGWPRGYVHEEYRHGERHGRWIHESPVPHYQVWVSGDFDRRLHGVCLRELIPPTGCVPLSSAFDALPSVPDPPSRRNHKKEKEMNTCGDPQ